MQVSWFLLFECLNTVVIAMAVVVSNLILSSARSRKPILPCFRLSLLSNTRRSASREVVERDVEHSHTRHQLSERCFIWRPKILYANERMTAIYPPLADGETWALRLPESAARCRRLRSGPTTSTLRKPLTSKHPAKTESACEIWFKFLILEPYFHRAVKGVYVSRR